MAAHHTFLKGESGTGRQRVITPLHPKHYRTDLAKLPPEACKGIFSGNQVTGL